MINPSIINPHDDFIDSDVISKQSEKTVPHDPKPSNLFILPEFHLSQSVISQLIFPQAQLF
jgi:hypothetical protein